MKTINPNDFGKKYLVEQCQKIVLSDFVRRANRQIKQVMLKTEIDAGGYLVRFSQSATAFGGVRFWFTCPLCDRRAGVLYRHPANKILACRTCLRLDYRKHRFNGMPEACTQINPKKQKSKSQ